MGEIIDRLVSLLMTLVIGFVIGVGASCYVYWKISVHYETEKDIYIASAVVINKANPLQSKFVKPHWPWQSKP